MQFSTLPILISLSLLLTGCQIKYHYIHNADIRVSKEQVCIFANDNDIHEGDYISFFSISEYVNSTKRFNFIYEEDNIHLPVMTHCVPYSKFKKNVIYDVFFRVVEKDSDNELRYSTLLVIDDNGQVSDPDDQFRNNTFAP